MGLRLKNDGCWLDDNQTVAFRPGAVCLVLNAVAISNASEFSGSNALREKMQTSRPVKDEDTSSLPWRADADLQQWHNEFDSQFGIGINTYYADLLAEELRRPEATKGELVAWEAPAARQKRKAKGT